MTRRRTAFGGVSARPNAAAVRGFEPVLRAAATGNGAYPGFTYNGGPVVSAPRAGVAFWGSFWQSYAAQTAEAHRLVQFCRDLVSSGVMNLLAQYGVGAATVAGTTFLANVPASLTNADIERSIQMQIDAGTLPEPPANNTSDVLMIFLDESAAVKDTALGISMCEPSGDTAFGYHDFFTTSAGNPFYYAVVPALDDACLKASCSDDATCSLHLAQKQEQRRTQVATHEFAEMATDPQLNAWTDPQNGEIGDICNGESATIPATGGGTWTVQRLYSKYDDEQTNGTTYCVGPSPTPIPKLPGGPA